MIRLILRFRRNGPDLAGGSVKDDPVIQYRFTIVVQPLYQYPLLLGRIAILDARN